MVSRSPYAQPRGRTASAWTRARCALLERAEYRTTTETLARKCVDELAGADGNDGGCS